VKKLAVIITLFCSPALSQIYQPINGWCQIGGQGVAAPITLGTTPIQQYVQSSYTGCTITIYNHGTTTPATLYSASTGTALSNPFQANSLGFYQAFAGTGMYDVQEGGNISPPVLLGSVSVLDVLEPVSFKDQNNIRYSSQYPGSDCGTQINEAYADLPSTGGTIIQDQSCTYSNPIVFGTNAKPVILRGLGDTATQLTYTGVGAAITLDYGTGLLMSKGVRDLYLTGPGSGTSTTGIVIGVTNGAQGTLLSGLKIESFGTDLTFGNNTWLVKVDHSLIRNANVTVLFPTTCTNCGENIQWDHVTFADMPTLTTGKVELFSGDHRFDSCSFDNAPLLVGSSSTAAVQVEMFSPHFENPNYATITGWYDYITMFNNPGVQVTIFAPTFEQDSSAVGTIPEFITASGGSLYLYGVSTYTPVGPVTQFIYSNNAANITLMGINDLSGQLAKIVGGTSTGYLVQIPGTNTTRITGFNNVFGPNAGSNPGGDTFDVTGNIRAAYNASVVPSGQLISGVPTGSEPLIVNSTTPVQNLFSSPTTYLANGLQVTNTVHLVIGQATLSGGTATVTLSGLAIFPSIIQCSGVDQTAANAVLILPTPPAPWAALTITGTSTDVISYMCVGY